MNPGDSFSDPVYNDNVFFVGTRTYGMQLFRRVGDLRLLSPAEAIVLIDEHEDTIRYARFISTVPGQLGWFSLPASRHGGLGAMSFADGHVSIRKWLDERTRVPVRRVQTYELIWQPGNADWSWFMQHVTAVITNAP